MPKVDEHILVNDREPLWAKEIKFEEPALIVGCGRGTLLDRGEKTVGIDPFNETVKVAKEKGLVIRGDAHYLPFKRNVFATIILIHSLEHFLCPYKALKEVYKVLKRNGKVIIRVPNSPIHNRERKGHYYGWNKGTMENLLRIAGFTSIQVKYIDKMTILEKVFPNIKNSNLFIKIIDSFITFWLPTHFRQIHAEVKK